MMNLQNYCLGTIWKYMKDLTMINKLKINESYYQSKYNNDEYSKDYTKPYSRQSFLDWRRGTLLKKSWEIRAASHKKNIISSIRGKFKTYSSKFLWRANFWTSDKFILQIEEILLNLKIIFPQNIMQKIPVFLQRKR